MNRFLIAVMGVAVVAVFGCGKTDEEVKESVGNAAVNAKHAAEAAGGKMKEAYDAASAKGKELAAKAGETLSDEALKVKIVTGFKLVNGLDAGNVNVSVDHGSVALSGTVPSQLDKVKAEGVAFGVTGDSSKVTSTVTVK